MSATTRHGATQPEKERAKKGRARLFLRVSPLFIAWIDRLSARAGMNRSDFVVHEIFESTMCGELRDLQRELQRKKMR
jgi:hypothetical protein